MSFVCQCSVYRCLGCWPSVTGCVPAFAKEAAGIENTLILQGVLGVPAWGSLWVLTLAARLSRNYIATSLIPVGIVGVAAGLVMLPQFTSTTLYALDFLLIGTAGGMFIVPLNALIQFHSREDELGKVIAVTICSRISPCSPS